MGSEKKKHNLETEPLPWSFEQYILYSWVPRNGSQTSVLRDNVTLCNRKVRKMAETLGIELEPFLKNGKYEMTRGLCELFDRLIDGYDAEFGRAVRGGNMKQAPEIFLIEVRALLYDAMRDAGCPEAEIAETIRFYEGKTGCPRRLLARKLSEPVAEVLTRYREANPDAKEDWDMVSDVLELWYQASVKPELYRRIEKEIENTLEGFTLSREAEERVRRRKSEQ